MINHPNLAKNIIPWVVNIGQLQADSAHKVNKRQWTEQTSSRNFSTGQDTYRYWYFTSARAIRISGAEATRFMSTLVNSIKLDLFADCRDPRPRVRHMLPSIIIFPRGKNLFLLSTNTKKRKKRKQY